MPPFSNGLGRPDCTRKSGENREAELLPAPAASARLARSELLVTGRSACWYLLHTEGRRRGPFPNCRCVCTFPGHLTPVFCADTGTLSAFCDSRTGRHAEPQPCDEVRQADDAPGRHLSHRAARRRVHDRHGSTTNSRWHDLALGGTFDNHPSPTDQESKDALASPGFSTDELRRRGDYSDDEQDSS